MYMRKIAFLFPVLVFLFSLSSCEDVLDDLTKFTVKDTSTVSIPATTVIELPITIATPEIEIDLSEEFDNNNSNKDLIESAKLQKMSFVVKSPSTGSFDFLNSVELYIEVEGEEKVLLASIYDIPEEQLTTINLDVTDLELKPYLTKDNYTISGKIKIDKTNEAEYEIDINSEFLIDAKILGI